MNTIRTNASVETVPYGQSVIPYNRLKFLGEKCKEVLKRVPGDVLEIGVYRGGTIIELAKAVQEVYPMGSVWGIDTFTGHPYTDGHPVHPVGKYSDVAIEELEKVFVEQKVFHHIMLYKGKVEEIFTLLHLSNNISFLHVDCDMYLPIKYCCEHITPLINKGGMIYLDDYGHEHCPGATRAVNEVFAPEKINEVTLDDGTCWSCYINL